MNGRVLAMLLVGALALPLAAPSYAQSGGSNVWNFRVYLDDKPIGYHRFTLTRQGEEGELKSEARFDVKVLFINAYRYVHDATERWSGRCLKGMTARTDDDGERSAVNATADGAALSVAVTRGSAQGGAPAVRKIDGCAMSFAYWDADILRQSRLLNSQTGEYEAVAVSAAGDDRVTVRGKPVDAKRYRITGPKNPIDLWYSAAGDWLALESSVGGGRRLIYRIE
jgi:hypothetical protein